MTVLQHYYTSCTKGTSGTAGFQCKAQSPGISNKTVTILNKLLNYRIPPLMDKSDIRRHPVALRYHYLGPENCILLSSQSNGTDEHGRPGNFFAHSLITTPKYFTVTPPIMFWRHPFWKTEDTSNSLSIAPLLKFSLQPSFDFDTVWPFLDQGKRRTWFYKLLCAIVHYQHNRRQIIILDTADNVALWVAAASFALPPRYRPLLTFATYHHDPYDVPFMIVGTTSDSKFRFSVDEYISYFVMNTEDEQISEVDDSTFAKYACDKFTPHLYEEELLNFFALSDRRDTQPRNISARLDMVTDYYQSSQYLLLDKEKAAILHSPTDLHRGFQSMQAMLKSFEALTKFTAQDIEDLQNTVRSLRKLILKLLDKQVIFIYRDALALLHRHNVKSTADLWADLDVMDKLILANHAELATAFWQVCRKAYPLDALTSCINEPGYVEARAEDVQHKGIAVHLLMWKTIGEVMRLTTADSHAVQALVFKALDLVNAEPAAEAGGASPAGQKLLDALVRAAGTELQTLLRIGLTWHRRAQGEALNMLYYTAVAPMPIAKRQPLRSLIRAHHPRIVAYELERELARHADSNKKVTVLLNFANLLQSQLEGQRNIINYGVNLSMQAIPQRDKKQLARSILFNDALYELLDKPRLKQLVNAYPMLREIIIPDEKTIQVYRKLSRFPNLDSTTQAAMNLSLALATGTLNENSVTDIQNLMSTMQADAYRQTLFRLLPNFFKPDVQTHTHAVAIKATYVVQHQEIFWNVYEEELQKLATNAPPTFGKWLSFWFEDAATVLTDSAYLVPSFFLRLPMFGDRLKELKPYRNIESDLHAALRPYPWASLVIDIFTQERRGLLGVFR
jgi:hypothetical protein